MDDLENVNIRYTEQEDAPYLKQWLEEGAILRWFPMQEPLEVEDAVKHWIAYSRYRCSLTATYAGKPIGLSTLYLMPYRKVAHQCLFSIIVDKDYRNKKVGTLLLNNIIHLAKEQFKIEYLYLEVYEGNPAIFLYKKFGFKEVGIQPHFIKENGQYSAKIIMERELV
jgi:ribosomal protein S18 acetylase RimI-like enzyme